jgi:hypothetical protein
MSEDQLTAKCFQYAWNYHPETRYLLFHIANEGATTLKTGASNKAKGKLPGVPDFAIVWDGNTHWCELKVEKGVLSTAQKNLHTIWSSQGVPVTVARSFEEFLTWLYDIIKK